MKKLIYAGASIAAMAIATPAMAQSASATPAGTTPAECAAGTNNCSVVEQDGTNFATIDQTGDGNSSDVSQTGTSSAPVNTVDVEQTGDDNFADIVQDTSDTNTTGVAAIILQEGINSLADIDQIGNAAGGRATVNQGLTTDFSFATIEQSGAMGGASNTATINQNSGFGNDAAIVQGDTTVFTDTIGASAAGNVAGSSGGFATVTQIGDANSGSVIQGGTDQTATVDQNSGITGNNFALVVQGSGGASSLNSADVDQSGNSNSSEIYQNDLTAGGSNRASVNQDNDDNFSRIIQNGSDHTATVTQMDGSSSFVTQSGTGNSVTVNQGVPILWMPAM